MSSILKALKKLENEFPEQNRIRFRPQKRRIIQAIYQRVKVPRFSIGCFFFIFSLMVLSVGGWLISKGQYRDKEPEFIAIKEIKPEKSTVISEMKPPVTHSPQIEAASLMGNEKSEPIPQAEKTPSLPARKVREKTLPLDAKTKIEPTKSLNISEKISALPDLSQEETTDRITNQKNEQNTKAKKFASIPVKQVEESRLELQAIAWSSDPKSRIVVVNGKIVREGGSVAGVIVTHIGKDDVFFKKGREEWRQQLRFK